MVILKFPEAKDFQHIEGAYSFQYTYEGKTWSFQLWAESFDDAEKKLLSLKESAILDGRIIEEYPSE